MLQLAPGWRRRARSFAHTTSVFWSSLKPPGEARRGLCACLLPVCNPPRAWGRGKPRLFTYLGPVAAGPREEGNPLCTGDPEMIASLEEGQNGPPSSHGASPVSRHPRALRRQCHGMGRPRPRPAGRSNWWSGSVGRPGFVLVPLSSLAAASPAAAGAKGGRASAVSLASSRPHVGAGLPFRRL